MLTDWRMFADLCYTEPGAVVQAEEAMKSILMRVFFLTWFFGCQFLIALENIENFELT